MYWSSGIVVRPHGERWSATASFHDSKFCCDDAVAGEVGSRYVVGTLRAAVDAAVHGVESLGIQWLAPHLFLAGDGEEEGARPPEGWRALLAAESERLGWEVLYRPDEADEDPDPAEA